MSENNHCHFKQIQGNFIIVIHPGSETLRIGRSTDTQPMSVPHVIARRHKHTGQSRYEDQCLLREGLNVCVLSFTLSYHTKSGMYIIKTCDKCVCFVECRQ